MIASQLHSSRLGQHSRVQWMSCAAAGGQPPFQGGTAVSLAGQQGRPLQGSHRGPALSTALGWGPAGKGICCTPGSLCQGRLCCQGWTWQGAWPGIRGRRGAPGRCKCLPTNATPRHFPPATSPLPTPTPVHIQCPPCIWGRPAAFEGSCLERKWPQLCQAGHL